ncbi:MAG: hypothetical protein OQL19_09165 [Gammaproteobacteria bacterium]|nr:hypothetical protein [Gammaproteobacteria bacterium]
MYSSSLTSSTQTTLNDFKLDGMMIRYSQFVPRLYNFCLSQGMEPGKIMPSRAFCSDESQGFPIILLAKQFGAFPFNHGMVGGIVSTGRHGPHASHGEDLMIIQATHVGYEPENQEFGIYRRIQTNDCHHSSNCGKIAGTLKWYLDEYKFACENIYLEKDSHGQLQISINNLLLHKEREEGLILDLDKLIAIDLNGNAQLIRSLSTARCFKASPAFLKNLKSVVDNWPNGKKIEIGDLLTPELFKFRRQINDEVEGPGHLEKNLIEPMPWIVTHPAPTLASAQILTQIEFDRTYRTIINESGYKNHNLIFISGLNIDISPRNDQIFPLTKFVPWAAFIQKTDGSHSILEQQELYDALMELEVHNEKQINLEHEIQIMEETDEVQISYDFLLNR